MRILALLFTLLISFSANALSPVKEVTSSSGIKAWLIEDHTNPIIALRFSFKGGAALDPTGKEGLARLAAATMDEGAGELRSQAFQARLEENSITLGFDAEMDSFGGQILTLTENLEETTNLLSLALNQPRFDEEAVERMRDQLIVSLKQSQEDPNTIAGRTLFKTLFEGHPYARGSKGTIEGMQAITKKDLQTFIKTRLAQDNLVVGVSGDITESQLARLLDQVFGKLPKTATGTDVPQTKPTFNGQQIVIDKPIPQSSILIAQAGIDRHDPDFYSAYVLNYILGGGGFSSRLYEEVREKRGLVYSVYSYLGNYDAANLWLSGAGTQNARVHETLSVIQEEWHKAHSQPISAQEVQDAKTYLTGSFPLRFRSSDTIAGILAGMQKDNLPITFLEDRNRQVEAVTVDDVNRVAKSLMTPDKLIKIVIGQPEGVASN